MPVRQIPVTEVAVRVLLDSIVDYAGLFPPAEVGMAVAVRNFAHYRASGAGWMLGRFICPANALEIFSRDADVFLPRDAGAIPWHLSVTGSGDVDNDLRAIEAFNERHRVCFDEYSAIIDAYEVKATSAADIHAIHASLPHELRTFVEIPLAGNPAPLLEVIAETGRRAKMRTGGTSAGAFPSSLEVAHFLELCAHIGVAAKATAGLHHPLRSMQPVTYAADSERAMMFGYINVFLAAALVGMGAPTRDVIAMLEETDATTLAFRETDCLWHHGVHDAMHPHGSRVHLIERALIAQVRERGLTSFGSCSFTEPVNETRALGWM